MIIMRERHPTEGIKGISWNYTQLDVLFRKVAKLFVDRSIQEAGILTEVKVSEKEILSALRQIQETLTKLDKIEKKFKFDKPVLHALYQEELTTCKKDLQAMKNSLNIIWDEGKPVKKTSLFAGTTNYKFVLEKLLKYIGMANDCSTRINDKARIFNRENKKIPQLQFLPMLTFPEWMKKL